MRKKPGSTSPLHKSQFHSLTPPVDALGGATITQSQAEALRMRGHRLQHLDVTACAELRALDLSRCATGLHLTIAGCPMLEYIRLPEEGPGAVVHLDAGERLSPLRINGAVAEFDACWADGDLALNPATEGRPYQGVWLGRSLDKALASGASVAIVTASSVAALAVPADSALCQLHLLHAPALRRVSLQSRNLERVTLRDCPRLETLDVDIQLRRLRLERCPAVNHIRGDGTGVVSLINGSGAESLELDGCWRHLGLTGSNVQVLTARRIVSLLLRECHHLQKVHTADDTEISVSGWCAPAGFDVERLNLDERAVDALLARSAQGDEAARWALTGWCVTARRPKPLLLALRALNGLARQADTDPAALWTLRCRLHYRANRKNPKDMTDAHCLEYAGEHWSWRLPDDLYQAGWDADLQLWLQCRGTEAAAHFGTGIGRHMGLAGLATVARELVRRQNSGAPPDADLHRLLQEAATPKTLARTSRRDRNYPAYAPLAVRAMGIDGRDMAELEQLLHAAAALREVRLARALANHTDGLNAGQRVQLLGGLIAFGHTPARAAMMCLVAELREPSTPASAAWLQYLKPKARQALIAQATALALSPARHDALAEPTEQPKEVMHA